MTIGLIYLNPVVIYFQICIFEPLETTKEVTRTFKIEL